MPLKILIYEIWKNLRKKRQVQIIVLFFLMLITGISEVLTLSTLYPFLTALTNPEKLLSNNIISFTYSYFKFTTPYQLLIPITITFGISALLTSFFRLLTLWSNFRLSANIGIDFSKKAFKNTIYQNYSTHLSRNSSEIISGVTTNISITINIITLILQMLTACFIVSSLLITLFIINRLVASITILIISFSYLLIAKGTKKKLYINSKVIAEKLRIQIKSIQESLGAIRDILLSGTQESYIKTYAQTEFSLRRTESQNQFLAAFPRYGIEGICMMLISVLTIILVKFSSQESTELISILGTLALGGQRMLPSIQQIYSGWASIKGNTQAAANVIELLNQKVPDFETDNKFKQLKMLNKIEFLNVSFRYSDESNFVFKNINLSIKKGDCIGLIGKTGSGKSTLIDLLMGLIEPTYGKILINGKDINQKKNNSFLKSWRASISHVPQSIFLTDQSIKENICLGFNEIDPNIKRIRQAANKAEISTFIEDLENKYETKVGERGVKLSGGQRQRIGIARSIYKEHQLLVLDEATSALDNITEKKVINNIYNEDKTIIMIAHRLTTLKSCNKIFKLVNQEIKEIDPNLVN